MNTEEGQKVFSTIGGSALGGKLVNIVLIILTVFLVVESIGGIKSLRDIDPAYNSISVTGEGEAVSIPDIATFSFTVSADADVVSEAQGEVTKKMDAILDGLKKLGIEEKDIKTTNYSVYPKYTYPQIYCITTPCYPAREQVQDGYTVSHDISVKVRDTSKAGEALALAGQEGATGLSSISFTVDDPDKIIEEARTLAIKDAKEKAALLSKDLGVRLVRVVSFYDNTGGPMPYYAEGFGGDGMKATVSAPAPTIPVGENKVTVNITVVYEIR